MENLLTQIQDFDLHKTIQLDLATVVIGVGVILLITGLFLVPKIVDFVTTQLLPKQAREMYDDVFRPFSHWLAAVALLIALDTILLVFQDQALWLDILEFSVGLVVAISLTLLAFKISSQFFDQYLLRQTIRGSGKANSELLLLYKYLSNGALILIIVFTFAQTHRVNVIGLLASLGVGGIAIALAAQKVLEQVLWSTLIFLDRPFVVDDYIYLADGTFGRVESIGWRSTRVRLSGKGTLVVIPNSMLTQMAIENLTGAQKIISLINISFYRTIPDEERALVRQLILSGTNDIYGIDHRLTEVSFKERPTNHSGKSSVVQAQVRFFILGSGENSMEIRGQFLEAARKVVMKQLRDYGIDFEIEEDTVNITSPMNI